MQHIVSKSQFKPHALKYLRNVEENKQPITITHLGKPVVKIIPFSEKTKDKLQAFRETVVFFKQPTQPVGQKDWEILQ